MVSMATFHSLFRYCICSPIAGPPLRASITLTNRCNLRCVTCATWNRGDDFSRELSTSELLKLIDELIAHGVRIFYFFGGEPFLHPGFFEIVAKVSKEHGLFSETVTNGTLLTEERVNNLFDAGMNKIWVSIDGPRETHDLLRGVPGTHAKAMAGLQRLCKEKLRRKSSMLIDLAVTVSHQNYRQLEELVESVKDLPLFEVNIRHMGVFFRDDIRNIETVLGVDLGGLKTPLFSSGNEYLLRVEDIPDLRSILKKLQSKKYPFQLHIEPHIFTVDDWRIGRKNAHTCLHIWTQLCINANGDVNPCMWWDGYVVGNIREKPVMELWNSEGFRNIRKNIRRLTACSKCTYFYLSLPENFRRALAVPHFPFKSLLIKK
ncbi:MAG: radical SAM protein [Chitinispirillaceae bacterium]|nr:radical SAM protein [Chitinispirillaceae bacterium]